ncbi:hypothetical protein [Natrinema marinum]|uniref:hypothetical protein n=1 Tax=Natrinema marinum TaxID=2961598 RepID=UPI0020C87885|nr:hypothetical protein [Natrinema marinum]
MTNRVTKLGVLFVLLGALTLLAPAFGFDFLAIDRGIDASVADDEQNAPLGVRTTYDGTTIEYETGFFGFPRTNTTATVAELRNNVDSPFTVEAEVSSVVWASGNDQRVLAPVSSSLTLGSGQTDTVELRCSQEVAGEASDATVDLDLKASGTPVTIDRREYTVSGVSFACEGTQSAGSGGPDEIMPIGETDLTLVNGSVAAEQSTGASQEPGSRVTFDVRNDGSDDIMVTGIGVYNTTSTANEVYYCANYWFFGCTATDNEVTIDGTTDGYRSVDEAMAIGEGNTYDLDQNATIATGDTATVAIEQFREDGFNTQVDMSGTEVTVVLVVEDNTTGEEVGIETELTLPP